MYLKYLPYLYKQLAALLVMLDFNETYIDFCNYIFRCNSGDFELF